MKYTHTLKIAILTVSFLVVSGCAMVPDEINVAENETLIKFETVANNQATSLQNEGKKARWGGKIVSVENKKDVSEIEIVYFPENSHGRPRLNEESTGRFKAVVDGFVDPIVFEEGRVITVVGEVGSQQVGIIGEQEYAYSTLNALGYHLWKETSNVQLDTFAFSPFGFGYHRSFFSPWYDPWHRRHSRMNIRYKKHNGHSQGNRVDRSQNNSGSSNSTYTPGTRSSHVKSSTSNIITPRTEDKR